MRLRDYPVAIIGIILMAFLDPYTFGSLITDRKYRKEFKEYGNN